MKDANYVKIKMKYVMKLKKEYRDFKRNYERVKAVDEAFYEGNHDYLRGKRLPKKLDDEIQNLWVNCPLCRMQKGFNTVLDIELTDLKKDYMCGKNSNKKMWIKAYMMNWICSMPDKADTKYFKMMLTSRESYREIVDRAYED